MRYKFRGKRKDTGGWVYGYYIKAAGMPFISCFAVREPFLVIPETVGQYIGLNDKNNIEIYEGDIIKWTDWNSVIRKAVVLFDDEYLRYCVWTSGTCSRGVCKHLADDVEIIGNIYDNPELLEEGETK